LTAKEGGVKLRALDYRVCVCVCVYNDARCDRFRRAEQSRRNTWTWGLGNESAPIQLAQCRFPGLAISDAKIQMYFSKKIHGSNFIKQHSETVMV